MDLISDSIPSLINGVSQQPASLRLPSQCEVQINAMSSVVEGLKKRPPANHLARLNADYTNTGDVYVHVINRDTAERYVVIISDGGIYVYDIEGNQKTVATPDGLGYLELDWLAGQGANEFMQCVTIADYTFILNRSVETAMDVATKPAASTDGLVFVKQANNGHDYKIKINGTVQATLTTSASGAVKTNQIAADLRTQLITNIGANYTITQQGSVLLIEKNDGGSFVLDTEDSFSGKALTSFKNNIQRFSDLPTIAPRDFIVEIVGDSSSKFDNYFVKFEPSESGSNFGEGVWKETVKPGVKYKFNKTTMPHALIRESDGTFTFKAIDWGERTSGDEDSAPEPSFISRKINDIFLFRNRLSFLSDENNIFSRPGEFFSFFRETATTVLDTDPIDIAASHTKVSILNHAVPYSEQLILFSDQTQFKLEAGDTLTSKTVSITPTTEFENSKQCKPVGAGNNIYFAVEQGNFSLIREYFVSDQTDAKDAANVTSHVPQYLPANITSLASASNSDLLIAHSKSKPNTLYIYKYLWRGDEKLQSSWSEWVFGGVEILGMALIGSKLYLVTLDDDGMSLEYINFSAQQTEDNLPYVVHLDRKVLVSHTALSGGNTTFTLPYPLEEGQEIKVINSLNGKECAIVGIVGNIVTVSGTVTDDVYIGIQYEMRYRFSKQYIKRQSGQNGAMVPVDTGRLQMKTWKIRYEESGFFKCSVTPLYRDTSDYIFTGRILGSGSNILGSVAIESGEFSFPVLAKNDQVIIEITNNTYLPCRLLSATWEAVFSQRSRRV